MSYFKQIVIIGLIAYIIRLFNYNPESRVHIAGEVSPGFEPVRSAFKANLEQEWERGGGAFVVFHKGKKVVDIYGGYADKESARLWQKDTMNVAFSATKAVSALCIARLVDEGRMNYDDLVSTHWPEFAQNGKENITVRWVMGHRSGLPFTDHPILLSIAKDHKAIAKVFEKQRPVFPPGTATGYHAVTYGWLVDQLIRRVDMKHRSVGQFYDEEFRSKYDLDFYIGLPLGLAYSVSRLQPPSLLNVIAEYVHAPSNFNLFGTLKQVLTGGFLVRTAKCVPWISHVGGQVTVNNPDIYTTEQGAALGIGTADALAQLFEKLRAGQILSKPTFEKLLADFIEETDLVTGASIPRGQGLMMMKLKRGKRQYKLYGHSGYGGQNVRIDLDNEITVAYLSNHLKLGLGDTARTYLRLLDALYESLEDL